MDYSHLCSPLGKNSPSPTAANSFPTRDRATTGQNYKEMDTRNKQTPPAVTTVLFDFDGVVVDTEAQYSSFWHQVGIDYLQTDELEIQIKGTTLTDIYHRFFKNRPQDQKAITAALDDFEQQMEYDYVPGLQEFASDLRRHSIQTAVVTSSSSKKMAAVFRKRPEIESMFDRILTAELFTRSKPAPDCFLLGMHTLGATPQETCIFEDSFNGLRAAVDSGASVIGLATTNSRESIAPFCQLVLDNFLGFDHNALLGTHRQALGRKHTT